MEAILAVEEPGGVRTERAMAAFNRSKARQWSRTAWAVAALFASLPLAGRVALGVWTFEAAWELAICLAIAGSYFSIRSHRHRTVPDSATLLETAIRVAWEGRIDEAIGLLDESLRLSPRLWQALEYRGELHLRRTRPALALPDLDAALQLAGEQPHLVELRETARIAAAARAENVGPPDPQ